MKTSCKYSILASALVAFACGGGSNTEQEFTDGCTSSTNLGEAVCECLADRAQETLSPEGVEFLIAGMSGDTEKAEELRGELDVSEAMAAGMFMVNTPATCAGEIENN